MANVSSVDNNLPALQASSEPSAGTDNNAVIPFGQWLAQENEPRDVPRPIRFKEQANQENDSKKPAPASKNKKLFAEQLEKPAKQTRSLFRAKTATNGQQNQVNGKPDTTQASGKLTAAQARTTKTSVAFKAAPATGQASTDSAPLQVGKAVTTERSTTKQGKTASTRATVNTKGAAANQMLSTKAASTGKATQAAATATTQPDALTKLKTDVKAIFNSLTPLKTTTPSKTSTMRAFDQPNQPKQPTVTLSTDKVKPIRLTTEPVIKATATKEGKTTLEHLKARKTVRLGSNNATQQTETQVILRDTDATAKAENAGKKGATAGKTLGDRATQVLTATENLEKPGRAGKKARGRKAKKAQRVQQGRQQHLPTAAQDPTAMLKDAEAVREGTQLQQAAMQGQGIDGSQTDSASADSNANNLMARSETGAQVSTSKSTAKASQAYASRSLSWLKALSDKTGQMSRQDPNWKVLEMKLDRGDGQMTIKVSREDDRVSISVQFSDDTVRAQAESQSAHILESLKEQYGDDVAFSFADEQKSAFSSTMDERATRRRRLRAAVVAKENAVQTERYARSNPDQHIWIG